MTRTFQLRDASALEITSRSGRILAIAEVDRDDIEVEGLVDDAKKSQVWRQRGRLHIRASRMSNAITVRCPAGVDLIASTDSGALELQGDWGEVKLQSQSGRIQVEQARKVDARTKSGAIQIERAHGAASAGAASGSIVIQDARGANAATVSGKIELHDITGRAYAMTVNGSISIRADGAGDINTASVSGGIDIRIPEHRKPKVRAKQRSGQLQVDCEPGDDLSIGIASVSGSARVRPL